MENPPGPMESHGLEEEGNRGLLWAGDHRDHGVVPLVCGARGATSVRRGLRRYLARRRVVAWCLSSDTTDAPQTPC